MRPRTLGEVAAAVGGAVREGADTTIGGVATDSRAVRPDSLFVALVGERLDGHDFIADALERGAAAVMVRSGFAVEAPAVHVRDTGQALLDLAAEDRRAFEGTVVAITGANGKTSTKDLAGAVVASRWRTHVSPSSFNNEVGLPQTLLGAPPDTDVIVAELGARHVGDVRRLCDVARPQVAVVTNVGLAHMEVFGSWEAIGRGLGRAGRCAARRRRRDPRGRRPGRRGVRRTDPCPCGDLRPGVRRGCPCRDDHGRSRWAGVVRAAAR